MPQLVPYVLSGFGGRGAPPSTISYKPIGYNFTDGFQYIDPLERGDVVILELYTYMSGGADTPFTVSILDDGAPWTTSGIHYGYPKYYQFLHCQIEHNGQVPSSVINQTLQAYVVGLIVWKNVRNYEFYEYNIPQNRGYTSITQELLGGANPSQAMKFGIAYDITYGNYGQFSGISHPEYMGPLNSEENVWAMSGPIGEIGGLIGNVGFNGINVGTAYTKNLISQSEWEAMAFTDGLSLIPQDVNVDPYPQIPYFTVEEIDPETFDTIRRAPNAAHYGYILYFRGKPTLAGWKIGHI